MRNNEYLWLQEDFEHAVATALIACYESKIKKTKGAAPGDRLNDSVLARLREIGIYIPSNDRIVIENHFDTMNDKLPDYGCIGLTQVKGQQREQDNSLYNNGYIDIYLFKKVTTPGKYWTRRGGGQVYEMYGLFPTSNNGVEGERIFFSIDKHGTSFCCDQVIPMSLGGEEGRRTEIYKRSEHKVEIECFKKVEFTSSACLQYVADRRFCWTITAQEKIAKAQLGCMQEEVKSLLYARSLPMTETGRKRPILHLVESHKRRIRNGTDINITDFLRGTQQIEMGGTLFKVNAPQVLIPKLSDNSKKNYFSDLPG